MSGATVLERGRRKAYRPLPPAARAEAARHGLTAYRRGDWFLAHELLEPAWMGSDDPPERALHSGLIKLAAAGVHAARGNRVGLARNLGGARERLGPLVEDRTDDAAADPGRTPRPPAPGIVEDLDLVGLLADIDRQIRDLESGGPIADPPDLRPAGTTR
jgi:hypothetical protein